MTEEATSVAEHHDHEPFWKRARGLQYLNFLSQLHSEMLFDTYFEIGTNRGNSLYPSRSRTVAVDPYFRVERNAIGVKPELHFFQCSSDEFFERDFLKRNGMSISFGFLDGMHLSEYLLRDFINAERNCREGSVLALHDCCPFSYKMLTRDTENLPFREAWTGDVWKLIPILSEHRPDLKLTVLNCKPTGLVIVSGLDPENDTLSRKYDKIVEKWVGIDLEDYGVTRFNDLFEYTDAQSFADDGFPLFSDIALKNVQALKPVKVST
ncbi:hypothetical protein [Paracoccus albus]|uniref:hypothetical protein n=1 Tax=Paracoccus albus TaxID=3017784 RepID=UPI0022F03A49|nr:hypothetical protein [Paracoccus albus]WBU60709.1 hypothetical protein PAF20_01940 [Paracoccus albus]